MRRLQLQPIAGANVQSGAEILREHHAPAGEDVGAHALVERAEQRIVGSVGEAVEQDARATDDGEPECALGHPRHPGQGGQLVGKAWGRTSVG